MRRGAIQVDLYTAMLSSYDADGYLVLQPDYPGEKGGQSHEAVFPLGMQARPLDPAVDHTGAASVGTPMLAFWENDKGLMMPFGDSRVVAGLPALDKGDMMVHGLKAPNFLRLQADGTCTLFTTVDGTATGDTVTLALTPTGFEHAAPWGRMTHDVNGFHITTHSKASLDLGGIAGIPDFAGISFGSYFDVTAASMHLNGTLITLGPGGAVSPLAMVSTLVPLLGLFDAAVIAVAALAAAATPTPASAALATTATNALGALATAMGTASKLLSTQSVVAT